MVQRTVPLAKLTLPRLYRPVPRDRLFLHFDESRAHPVIWVTGPSGIGKTTLIASYIRPLSNRSLSEDGAVIRFDLPGGASLSAAEPFDGFEHLTAHLGARYRVPRRLHFHPHPYAFRV